MSPTKESHTGTSKNSRPIDGQDTSSKQDNNMEAIAAELSGTDLGQLINEYKNVVIAIIVLFILGAVSYVSWKSLKSSQHESARVEVMNFKKDILIPVQAKNKTITDLFTAYQQLVSTVGNGAILMEVTPEIMGLIRAEANSTGNNWVEAFSNAQKLCNKQDFCFLHFGLVTSNLLEEQGKLNEAFAATEVLVGNPYAVEDKLYFDLVRLSHQTNKLDKKEQYLGLLRKNHITSNYKVLAEQL